MDKIRYWYSLVLLAFVTMMKAGILLPVVYFVSMYPYITVWILFACTFAWSIFPVLDWLDHKIGRWWSLTVLTVLCVGLWSLIYFTVRPWVQLAITEIVAAGSNIPALKDIPLTIDGFKQVLMQHTTEQVADLVNQTAKWLLGNHGDYLAGLLISTANEIAILVVATFLITTLALPLIVLLHAGRADDETGVVKYLGLVFDGKNGFITKFFVNTWLRYLQLSRGVFGVISLSMLIFSIVYGLVILGFRMATPSEMGIGANVGYAVMLGVFGAIPIIGGAINTIIVTYIGWTTYGFLTSTFIWLMVAQCAVYTFESFVVTPWLMGNLMRLKVFGLFIAYALSVGIFGPTATGFLVSFMGVLLAIAVFEELTLLQRRTYVMLRRSSANV